MANYCDGKKTPDCLVLEVGLDESIIIDDKKIVVTLVNAGPGWSRLAFKANRDVKIDRKKIYEAKKAAGTY